MMMEIKQEQFGDDPDDEGHSGVTTDECDKRLLYARHLVEGRLIHGEESNLECKVCGSVFNDKGDLTRHTKAVHSTAMEIMVKSEEYTQSFPCQTDSTNYAKVHSGDMTKIKQEKLDCDQNDEEHASENSSSLTQSLVPGDGSEFLHCGKCMEVFTSKIKFHQHVLHHSGVTTYKCEKCDEKFLYKSDFMKHRHIHSETNDFPCQECGKVFFSKSHLQYHRPVHTGEKNFECEECGKMFSRKTNLTRHTIIHTGMKTIRCRHCGKLFNNKSHLASHAKNVHFNKGDFTCDKCGANFQTKCAITQHVLTH